MQLRLLIISPTPPPSGDEGPHSLPVPDYLAMTKNLDIIYCEGAPPQIWDAAGCARVDPLIREKAAWAATQKYDAIIIQCMLDPSVTALKRALDIPVVGTGEASEASARLLGNRSARIYAGRIPVYELEKAPDETYSKLLSAAKREIERGADVLILACAHLDIHAKKLQDEVSVPVLPCVQVAIKSAEMLAIFGLHPCKQSSKAAKLIWLKRKVWQRSKRFTAALRH